jgi:SAM-dependent methyltransferase
LVHAPGCGQQARPTQVRVSFLDVLPDHRSGPDDHFYCRSGLRLLPVARGSHPVINVAWGHNSYYHDRVLRALPAPCGRVLDVGCGAGRFAAQLAERADRVDALDRSPAMITEARRIVPANVTCLLGDAATADLSAIAYDAVTSISALHHMDLWGSGTRLSVLTWASMQLARTR